MNLNLSDVIRAAEASRKPEATSEPESKPTLQGTFHDRTITQLPRDNEFISIMDKYWTEEGSHMEYPPSKSALPPMQNESMKTFFRPPEEGPKESVPSKASNNLKIISESLEKVEHALAQKDLNRMHRLETIIETLEKASASRPEQDYSKEIKDLRTELDKLQRKTQR